MCWSYGVMVSTLDSESSDPGSNPGRTSFCTALASGTTTLLLLRFEATHNTVSETRRPVLRRRMERYRVVFG